MGFSVPIITVSPLPHVTDHWNV